MTVTITIRHGHLDHMPRCEHGRIEGYCSACEETPPATCANCGEINCGCTDFDWRNASAAGVTSTTPAPFLKLPMPPLSSRGSVTVINLLI